MVSPSLVKNKNNCINPCGYKTLQGVIETGGTAKYVTARMYCKRWSCPECGPRRAWMYQQLIAEKAKEFQLNRFMTLTLKPSKIKGDSYKYLNECWRKLREAFRRKHGRSISYIAITEEHKSGIPHKHVLVDRYIHQKWLSAKWSNLGGGHRVDMRMIKDLENMARYVGKYLTKDILLSAPKGTRRITTSQNIKLRDKVNQGTWAVSDANLETLYEMSKHRVENVLRDKNGRLKSFEAFKPIDLTHWGVPNDRPFIQDGDRKLFPELPEFFELIATYEKEDIGDETGSSVRKSFEQGTTPGGFFNSRTAKTLGGLCPGAWYRSTPCIRGRGNRKACRPSIFRSYVSLLEEAA